MMTLWCLFGSPMMIGAELTLLDDWTLSLLTNQEVLNLLTPKCKPHQICRNESEAIWIAENEETNQTFVALFNLSDSTDIKSVKLTDLNIEPGKQYTLYELWAKESRLLATETIEASIPAHGCTLYEIQW